MVKSGGWHITYSLKKVRYFGRAGRQVALKKLPIKKQIQRLICLELQMIPLTKVGIGIGMFLLMNPFLARASENQFELNFDVFLNGKLMGWHSYKVSDSQGHMEVESKTQLRGRIFVIKRVDYKHQSNEKWSHGCLQSLNSETKSGKEKTTIQGTLTDDGFVVNQNGSSRLLPACTRTFAYWKPDLLQADFLLNPDTGRHLPVTFDKQSVEDGIAVTLKTQKQPIILKYDHSGNWLTLESKVKSIIPIKYLRSKPL
jgi:hypothetical protein